MNRHQTTLIAVAALGLVAALAGCAGMADSAGKDQGVSEAEFQRVLRGSFRAEGIAGMERLTQDLGQAACSTGKEPDEFTAARLEAESMATVRPPSDGRYLGDWREGEKLAQSGRGQTWVDKSVATSANGGNCYNCHHITKAEISFGTIGPSLYQYGKLRGVSDPAAPESKAIVEYTWGRLFNSWSYKACSNMPRFGHKGLLDEQQMRHLMALLLDPASPVNR
jgi:L-cysteine S-thiosulfotransferase